MNQVDPLVAQMRDRRHQVGVAPWLVAHFAGISHQAAYYVESGARDPRLSTLRALADALGCDLALVPRTTPQLAPAARRGTQPERNTA